MIRGSNILIGITGGIAAYKMPIVVRLLVKQEAVVRIIMTEHAREFVTPLTLATVSKNPVLSESCDPESGNWNSHIDLGMWANLLLIAPATANTIAKMAAGIADNLLLTTWLSARCPVIVAPSMDVDMLGHPATARNIETLRSYGNIILDPESGELASGLTGKGRMVEPEEIVKEIEKQLSR
jgi:phosphopantothenoylcysteine decarboxylase/phosphopantothenate--cysteine ligase